MKIITEKKRQKPVIEIHIHREKSMCILFVYMYIQLHITAYKGEKNTQSQQFGIQNHPEHGHNSNHIFYSALYV